LSDLRNVKGSYNIGENTSIRKKTLIWDRFKSEGEGHVNKERGKQTPDKRGKAAPANKTAETWKTLIGKTPDRGNTA